MLFLLQASRHSVFRPPATPAAPISVPQLLRRLPSLPASRLRSKSPSPASAFILYRFQSPAALPNARHPAKYSTTQAARPIFPSASTVGAAHGIAFFPTAA